MLVAGKRDVLGAVDQDLFASGDGSDQFLNQALIANRAFLLGLPYSSITFATVSSQDWGRVTAFAYDTGDHTAEAFDCGSVFSKGVIAGSGVKVDTHYFGLPGQQHIGVLWKHVPLTDLRLGEPPPGEYPEPTVPNSYTLFHGFDQYLVRWSEQPTRAGGCSAPHPSATTISRRFGTL